MHYHFMHTCTSVTRTTCSNLTSRSFLFGARESGETSSSLHRGHVNSVSSRCSLMPAGGGRRGGGGGGRRGGGGEGGEGGREGRAYVIQSEP